MRSLAKRTELAWSSDSLCARLDLLFSKIILTDSILFSKTILLNGTSNKYTTDNKDERTLRIEEERMAAASAVQRATY